MDGGLIIVGWVLQMLLCRLDGLKAVDCKQLHPQQVATKTDCDAKLSNIGETFPGMAPEMFGLPKGTRLQIHMKCRPLYGDLSA
jgi:hypothetical protein